MESNSYLEVGSLNERLVSTIVPRKGLSISNIFHYQNHVAFKALFQDFPKQKLNVKLYLQQLT
jgi:hypothetical protein